MSPPISNTEPKSVPISQWLEEAAQAYPHDVPMLIEHRMKVLGEQIRRVPEGSPLIPELYTQLQFCKRHLESAKLTEGKGAPE